MEQKSNKTIVLECYRKIIRDLDLSLVDSYVSENYIQHSPIVKDGKEGLLEMLAFLKTLPKPAEQGPSPVMRVIADGDLVAAHLDIKFMGQRVAVIDLFRLADGKIAEHWDAGQTLTDEDEDRVTMTNGTTVIDETADANMSKSLISDFFKNVFEKGDAANNYLAADYAEHNTANRLLSKMDSTIKVHRIIGEGNFVVAHCECITSGKTFAQIHIFRVDVNKITEHWSVEQEVPEVMAHGNGMF
ncbi:nuclear transport factor 2 family protein [Mucilaginibacter sp.]|uniref:nuclear transport factor 2 family protein n=1 Tax=Mucilaginibacter sp. TaxID=1882438 RepID=UPI00262C6293|nr:nuclear transport factor 2 family protein [Mucilaginibacter sp.]MDB4923667.1 putative SnoaL-like aldol condensation-catalyzing enzyme [Mucilaginibacter sp.]